VSARHGLVIGKFYPPHAGHHLLVREAARRSERVTVVVMAASCESIPLETRVAWMREEHRADANVTVTGTLDDHAVDYESDALWRAHVALMVEAASSVTAEPVDAVFTSEPYGEELGRRLGARHELVDLARSSEPVSGTAVRANPPENWRFLSGAVRRSLALRVVLVGAESTGKTTLAAALAKALRARGGAFAATQWVEEAGREHTEHKLRALGPEAAMESLVWETPDFVAIASLQREREGEAATRGGPVLVCDTDAFATGIWHERYVGCRAPEVEAIGTVEPHHLYLLTHPDDVPFEDDGLRDGEHVRAWMTERFVARLDETGRRWCWIRGARADRERAAMAAIDEALTSTWRFADPLG
jgi:HTH-type transcriptional repressor of NAD biosynthesis genes